MEKRCRLCGETKPTTEFYANRSRRDGLQSECKTCSHAAVAAYVKQRCATDPAYREARRKRIADYKKARYATDPDFREATLERQRRRQDTPEHRAYQREQKRRWRAKKRAEKASE